jgi:hypothetical protein
MTMTTTAPKADAPASAETPTPALPQPGTPADESTLFTPMPAKRRTLVLPERKETILLEALNPKEYDELNHAATVTDPKDGSQTVDNRMWNARFVARALRRANGSRMYNGDNEWRALAIQIAAFWTVGDTRVAAEAAADVTGVSAEARKAQDLAVGKGSAGTATIGGNTI